MKKNSVHWLAIVLIVMVALTVSACAAKVPLNADQEKYAGKWVAQDGTYVQIYLDGGGDLKSGNTKISGGRAIIEGDTLTISLGPMERSYKITGEPREKDGKWIMELDGHEYVRK